jgi:uncharacterized RDD family membrane protein YckC
MPTAPNSGPAAPPPPAWDARPTERQPTGYGGFWRRVVAYLIDGILLSIGFRIVGSLVGIAMYPVDPAKFDFDEFAAQVDGIQLVLLAASWLYFALMESSPRGATVGKMAVGLRVVDLQGNRLTFGRATGRFFAKFISAVILMLGYLMVAFDDRKRGLHDMIAATLVVKLR